MVEISMWRNRVESRMDNSVTRALTRSRASPPGRDSRCAWSSVARRGRDGRGVPMVCPPALPDSVPGRHGRGETPGAISGKLWPQRAVEVQVAIRDLKIGDFYAPADQTVSALRQH